MRLVTTLIEGLEMLAVAILAVLILPLGFFWTIISLLCSCRHRKTDLLEGSSGPPTEICLGCKAVRTYDQYGHSWWQSPDEFELAGKIGTKLDVRA